MAKFADAAREAAIRHGGAKAVAAMLPEVKTADELRAVADDRYLSLMSRRIFRAGLNHTVVDNKWPAFEEAFRGFVPARVRAMSDEALEALMKDTRLVRHWAKIRLVRDNAAAMAAIQTEAGSFAAWLADWPATDTVGLWDALAKRFSQMGGNSAPRFLRMAGKDTFVLTDDVVRALKHWGFYTGTGKGKRERAAIQAAFNTLAAETKKPLGHISRILSLSVD
ncbi:MAG: DNA-3-methyladenine glycosylase I [Rhodospirillaceae bacterium]